MKGLTRLGRLWESDITYIRIGSDFSYIILITDAYSHKIIDTAVAETLHYKSPLAALHMATETLQKGKESLIHHSDRVCSIAVKILFNNFLRTLLKSV